MATIVDSYSEVNKTTYLNLYAVHPGGVSVISAGGQAFTGDGQQISSCKFYLCKDGNPGRIIARLYAHTGTFGSSSLPTGAALDSSNVYDTTDIDTTNFALFEFTGFSGYTLVNGTKYCIVIEAYDGLFNAANRINVGDDASSLTHDGIAFYYLSGWATWANNDICFYVYGVPAPQEKVCTETLALTGSLTKGISQTRTESLSLVEIAVTMVSGIARTFTEVLNVVEATASFVKTLNRTFTETVKLTGSKTKAIVKATFTDAISVTGLTIKGFGRTLTEAMSLAEATIVIDLLRARDLTVKVFTSQYRKLKIFTFGGRK